MGTRLHFFIPVNLDASLWRRIKVIKLGCDYRLALKILFQEMQEVYVYVNPYICMDHLSMPMIKSYKSEIMLSMQKNNSHRMEMAFAAVYLDITSFMVASHTIKCIAFSRCYGL